MSVDPIQMACMADLGRQRQEELPLSNKEGKGKGPSFAPSRRNGTGHIAPDLKKGLETKWNVQINDEESEQMKGLAVEDSRPWAKKIAQDFINRNQVFTAPPRIRQESKGHKRAKESSLQKIPAASLGGLIPPGGSVRHFSASKSTGRLPSKSQVRSISDNVPGTPPNTNNCELQTLRSNPNSKMASPTPSPAAPAEQSHGSPEPVVMSLPNRPSKPQEPEHIVLRGICKLLNPKDRSVLFVISYIMKVRKDTDEGYLVLSSSGKEDRIHNVLELLAPDTRDDCCRVCSRAEKNGFAYILQFPNIPDAHKFKIYLESLQQAAAREASMEQKKANQGPMAAEAAQEPPTSPTTSHPAIDSPSLSATLETTDPVRPAVDTPPFTVSTSAKHSNAKGGEDSMELVDLEPPSCSRAAAREFIIEDAAEKLVGLIDKILPEAAEAGLILSDDTVAHIQEVAIDDWLNRGFLASETDDMKTDLLELLCILVRIKRKAESRRQARPVIQSLQGFDMESRPNRITYSASQLEYLNTAQSQQSLQGLDREARPSRIQYNAAELEMINATQPQETLRGKCTKNTELELERIGSAKVNAPAALATNVITPRRTPKVTSSPAASVANFSKYKDWLGEKPREVVASPKSTGDAASSGQSPHMTTNGATASRKEQSSTSGLGTSRWARN
ncbi:hypothetical protein J3459_005984 [Metarhizium acridum]|nr:hypothetical protein J3459_005984 [Metarhizium acridum]